MNTIGIFSGKFQPPHKGHVLIYHKLKQIVGGKVFIATSDKTPTPDFPLNFGEKEHILVRHGIPANYVIKVENLYYPSEIFHKVSETHTNVVFAFSAKSIETLGIRKGRDSNNKEIWISSDGVLNYFQPYKGNENKMKSLDTHGYVWIIEDVKIDGKPISSENIREVLGSSRYNEKQKKSFFEWAFGWYDIGLYTMLVNKFKYAHQSSVPEVEKMPSMSSLIGTPIKSADPKRTTLGKSTIPVKEQLRNIIKEILDELIDPPASATPSTPMSSDMNSSDSTDMNTDMSSSDLRKKELQNKKDAINQKSAAERELKSLESDLKWKDSSIQQIRKDQIPTKRSEIDDLNKQISSH